jgi:hypothetical protein
MVTGVATYAVLASGLVQGVLALSLLVALLLVVPTARDLTRRLALNGAVFLGWVPVTWWVNWPVHVHHAAVAVALAVAWLAWHIAGASLPRARLRAMVPRVHRADLLLPVSALLAVATMWRWAFPGTPRAALVTMLPGVDNSAHFTMYSSILRHGAPSSSLGNAPDGSRWGFTEYPQGFHSLVATFTELGHPRLPAGEALLTSYTQGVALVVVLGLTVLTAAVVSLPMVAERFWVALPMVVLTWSAFLWRPGQNLLADGFANFWFASLAAAVALLVCLPSRPRESIAAAVAVAGLIVAAAYGWAPMAVLAAPAGLALFLALRGSLHDPPQRRRVLPSALPLAVAAILVLHVLWTLARSVGVGSLVSAPGGVQGTNSLPTLVLLVVGVYLLLAGPTLLRSRHVHGSVALATSRARVLVLTPVAAVLLATALLVAQMRALGETSYYFLKFMMGIELVLAGLVPGLAAMLLAALLPTGGRRAVRVGAAIAATLAATQFFGVLPRGAVPTWDAERPGTAALGSPYSADRMADRLLQVTRAYRGEDSLRLVYIAIGADGVSRVYYPDTWFHGLLLSESSNALDRTRELSSRADNVREATPVVRKLLREHEHVAVVVAPEHVQMLRQQLGNATLAERVVSWR